MMAKEKKANQKTSTRILIEMYVSLCDGLEDVETESGMKESDEAMSRISKLLIGHLVSANVRVNGKRKLLPIIGVIASVSGNEAVIKCSMGDFVADVMSIKSAD